MTNYPISICIPTYNRDAYLNELLEAIHNTTKSIESNYQIVISDNHSTDNTMEVINSWISKRLPIKYIRNNANFGMNYNISNCINYSDGEYSLLFGDDDIITDGSLNLIWEFTKAHRPDVLISNRYLADINMNIKGEEHSISGSTPTLYDFRNNESMNYFDKTLSTIGIFSFISILCIRTSAWKNCSKYAISPTSLFPHAIKIMDILINQKGKLLHLPAATAISRVNDRLAEEFGSKYTDSEFFRWNIHFEGLLDIAELFFKSHEENFLKFIRPIRNILINGRDDYLRMANESGSTLAAQNILYRLKIEY